MIEIPADKQSLRLENPVMAASGAFGFAGEYAKLIDLNLLGALVTNPVTLRPRRPATGTRVVPIDSGVLVHTGLPNPGIYRVHRQYAVRWKSLSTPIIIHLLGTVPDDVGECAHFLDHQDSIAGIEIGLSDSATHRDASLLIGAARKYTQLPILARLPLYQATHVADAAVEAGANALVVAGPPRGTVRDPLTGQLIGGRLYGPWFKALALRAVGQIARHVKVPVIGCGGIHHPDDARDYLEAGAIAVQIDSVAWVRPDMVTIIARNLGGTERTRVAGALPDEWYQGIGETATGRAQILPSPPPLTPPGKLPEA
jgi:dihydroorotate dehydrogenase (NAD+) catalytic subunit